MSDTTRFFSIESGPLTTGVLLPSDDWPPFLRAKVTLRDPQRGDYIQADSIERVGGGLCVTGPITSSQAWSEAMASGSAVELPADIELHLASMAWLFGSISLSLLESARKALERREALITSLQLGSSSLLLVLENRTSSIRSAMARRARDQALVIAGRVGPQAFFDAARLVSALSEPHDVEAEALYIAAHRAIGREREAEVLLASLAREAGNEIARHARERATEITVDLATDPVWP